MMVNGYLILWGKEINDSRQVKYSWMRVGV